MNTEYIYIPFNKNINNYLEEIEKISTENFQLQVIAGTDQHSILLSNGSHQLVSVCTNPVYAIVTKLENTALANSLYELITLQSKKICN